MIGAGVAGTSAAHFLASAGVKVTLVDAGRQGQATAAGAGIVSYAGTSAPQWWISFFARATRHLRRLAASLLDEDERDIGYRAVGELIVAPEEEGFERLSGLARSLEARQQESYDEQIGAVSLLAAEEARRLFPPLSPLLPAVHLSGVGRLDGRLFRDALARRASSGGSRFIKEAARLRPEPGGRVGVETRDGVLRPDAVIVAAGAWTPELLAPLGVSVPVEPQRGQIVHLELDAETEAYPVLSGHGRDYIVTFPPNRVVCGATRETGSGFDYRTTAGGVDEILSRALAVAPGLRGASVREIRVGFRPASPDGLPLLGPLPSHPEVHLATGFGPSGLTLGPYAASLVARSVIGLTEDDGALLEDALARFSPSRFAPEQSYSTHKRE